MIKLIAEVDVEDLIDGLTREEHCQIIQAAGIKVHLSALGEPARVYATSEVFGDNPFFETGLVDFVREGMDYGTKIISAEQAVDHHGELINLREALVECIKMVDDEIAAIPQFSGSPD